MFSSEVFYVQKSTGENNNILIKPKKMRFDCSLTFCVVKESFIFDILSSTKRYVWHPVSADQSERELGREMKIAYREDDWGKNLWYC